MVSDLIFYILPRLGKAPVEHHSDIVQKVTNKQSRQQLSDEEQELHAEERDAREKHHGKSKDEDSHGDSPQHSSSHDLNQSHQKSDELHGTAKPQTDSLPEDHNYTDADGQRHIDDFA